MALLLKGRSRTWPPAVKRRRIATICTYPPWGPLWALDVRGRTIVLARAVAAGKGFNTEPAGEPQRATEKQERTKTSSRGLTNRSGIATPLRPSLRAKRCWGRVAFR